VNFNGKYEVTAIPILILFSGSLASLIFKPRYSAIFGCISACVGSVAALVFYIIKDGSLIFSYTNNFLEIFFMIPIALLGIVAAINSIGYLKGHSAVHVKTYWFFFNLMLASMFSVLVLNAPVHFLLAWEAMGITSAALVAFNFRTKESTRATWIYLIACHAGAVFLILMFIARTAVAPNWTVIFILALLGFGLKCGFMGLHVWLPEAHPAAPSPVSAIMSGAMINLGFFGILKFGINSVSPAAAGWTFLLLGIAGALLGIMFAMTQSNIKRLLAFSSIENMGIIAIGMGLGFLGLSRDLPLIASFAFTGAVLHIINHALLKGCLFLCAGAVLKATGSLDMDEMGGLMKRMPQTGTLFALNGIGISGIPPLNGFMGEFFIYMAALMGLVSGGSIALGSVGAAVSLAFAGGLAVATFSKAAGATFLGEPRSEIAATASEVSPIMVLSSASLFVLSVCLSFIAPLVLYKVGAFFDMSLFSNAFFNIFIAYTSFLIITVTVLLLRFQLLPRSKDNIPGMTWDCGYAKPAARMAYTGTAFTQPLTNLFSPLLQPIRNLIKPAGLFPGPASVQLEVSDGGVRFLWAPIFDRISSFARKIHPAQSGRLHAYILAMVVATILMLAWGLLAGQDQPDPENDNHQPPVIQYSNGD
jgi:hydrogenase-4 component B